MHKHSSTRRVRRKAHSCLPLFDWARDAELLIHPAVRAVTRRTHLSPALALAIAELSGLIRERR
jgi:hypothetical protein